VEAVTPVDDPELQVQLKALMELYLEDSSAWHMQSDGNFIQLQPEGDERLSQTVLMEQWRDGLKMSP
jgi:polyphosphate kinase